jgi:heat shock protein 1/8
VLTFDHSLIKVILVGASTLLPGIANNLRMLFPPAVPVTTTLDPSQVIAVGCALQAYHLAQLPEELPIPDILSATASKTVSAPVGIVFPGQPSEDDLLHAVIIPSGLRLPCRRQVQFEVTPGSTSVAVELWEGKYDVKVEKQEPTPRDPEDEEFSDDEEEEDIRTSICKRTKQLLAIEFPAEGKNEVTLEVIINEDGSVQCKPAQ